MWAWPVSLYLPVTGPEGSICYLVLVPATILFFMENSRERHCCKRVARWLPPIYITLGVFWGYYAYLFELCLSTVTSDIERTIYMVVFNVLFLMTVLSYCSSMWSTPGSPPEKFYLTEPEKELYNEQETPEDKQKVLMEVAKFLPISEIRYCETCQLLKPDRCFHCTRCDICVLKMDHHCIWLNNCVGHSNYKAFLLLIMYSFLSCLFISGTSFRFFILAWKDEVSVRTVEIRVLFCVSTAFAIILLLCFLLHCYLLVTNQTTVERLKHIDPAGRGGRPLGSKNFRDVFGQQKRFWLIPIETNLGDGYSLPPLPDDEETCRVELDSPPRNDRATTMPEREV